MVSRLKPLIALLGLTILLGVVVAMAAAPARAAGHVSVSGTASTTSASQLQISGSGFQAIKNGHGGVYVLFGTVKSGWRPSQGGSVGEDYFYVPDSETKNNNGYQRFVAFPGSDTAGAANAQMSANGSWSVSVNVPGPTFKTFDRSGNVTTIDCRAVTCGVITIGAHGVTNAHNETFTPVRFADPAPGDDGADAPAPTSSAEPAPDAGPTDEPTDEPTDAPTQNDDAKTAKPGRNLKPALKIDQAAAVPGRALSFTAVGLPPRAQVTAVLDDGVSAEGPFLVGDDGKVAGVIDLPADLSSGTHELRLFGLDRETSTRFPVVVDDATTLTSAASSTQAAAPRANSTDDRLSVVFALASGVIFVLVAGRVLWRRRSSHAS